MALQVVGRRCLLKIVRLNTLFFLNLSVAYVGLMAEWDCFSIPGICDHFNIVLFFTSGASEC